MKFRRKTNAFVHDELTRPTEFDFSEDAREPALLASELCFAYGVYQSERIGTANKNKVIFVNFKDEIVAVMRKGDNENFVVL